MESRRSCTDAGWEGSGCRPRMRTLVDPVEGRVEVQTVITSVPTVTMIGYKKKMLRKNTFSLWHFWSTRFKFKGKPN